jgi:hypothetical protein
MNQRINFKNNIIKSKYNNIRLRKNKEATTIFYLFIFLDYYLIFLPYQQERKNEIKNKYKNNFIFSNSFLVMWQSCHIDN